jgi:hypothetical protein
MKRIVTVVMLTAATAPGGAGDKDAGIAIDKAKRTISIDAKIAPRKLPHLKEVYPIEVIASWPHPKGKKAHETVVTIEANPSAVHKALVDFGLKPGTPVMGGEKEEPKGPEVNVYLEIAGPDGEARRITIDRTRVSRARRWPSPIRTRRRKSTAPT